MTDSTPDRDNVVATPPLSPQATSRRADTFSVAGLELNAGERTPRRRILAWSLWDWGSASFNAIVTTFVFTVYLTSNKGFGGEATVNAQLGWALGIGGAVVAVLAPITGQRSDGSGRRKFWLAIHTAVVVVAIALLFFIEPKPGLLWVGLALVAIGTVFYEFATVNYNGMLTQIATPKSVGKISGLGWAMGYFGGIVLLLFLYFGLIHPDVGLFGVTDANGLNVRVSMLIAAAWFLVFALPVLFSVPEIPRTTDAAATRPGILASYRALFRDVARLWRESRVTVQFLIASAIFRDGLTGVFTFGGVLAAGTFGFSAGEVIIFAVAANVVAGVSTVIVGSLDDRVGPQPVILVSLVGLVVAGGLVFAMHGGGQTAFWVLGLILCLFVGPAQSASRSYLARLIPAGREGEIFGLYATTGKAATFLAPTLFAVFVSLFGAQYWGVLGIVLVLLAGLLLMIPVRAAAKRAAA